MSLVKINQNENPFFISNIFNIKYATKSMLIIDYDNYFETFILYGIILFSIQIFYNLLYVIFEDAPVFLLGVGIIILIILFFLKKIINFYYKLDLKKKKLSKELSFFFLKRNYQNIDFSEISRMINRKRKVDDELEYHVAIELKNGSLLPVSDSISNLENEDIAAAMKLSELLEVPYNQLSTSSDSGNIINFLKHMFPLVFWGACVFVILSLL